VSDDIDDDIEAFDDEPAPEPAAAATSDYVPLKLESDEEADETDEKDLGAYPNPPLEECPVVPLGHYGNKVVFAMPEGEIRHEAASKVGQMLRTDIFACVPGVIFLNNWRDKKEKLHRELAVIWLVRKCREAGYWDTNRTTRSLGVWPGSGDVVMLHLGDQVWTFGSDGIVKRSIVEMMRERSGPLYKIAPPAPRPAKPARTKVGDWIRECLSLWNFEPIGPDGLDGGDILAGWLMAALLGGVAPFRGHMIVYGSHGAGKTTLVQFIHALASTIAGELLNSFSDAGFRSDISGLARPVFLDETESSASTGHGPGPVEQAIVVLRRMSTGDGSKRKQGGGENGGSTTQTALGSALLGAITPPKLETADASRFFEVRLRPLASPKLDASGAPIDMDAHLKAMMAEAKRLAPAIFGRAVVGADRYRADVSMIKAALVRTGEKPRSADLVAMVAAGRRLLLHDKPLDAAGADAEILFWKPLLAQRQASEIITNVGADALGHLLAFETSVHRNDRKVSIGLMVERLVAGDRDYVEMLKTYGLQVWDEGHGTIIWEAGDGGPQGRPGPWLIVANNHPQLKRIFAGTRWDDWRRALGFLDDLGADYATWTTKGLRYGTGVKQRGLAIPLTPLLDRLSPSSSDRSGGVPATRSGHAVDFDED
jgi:hypothetical protein